MCGKDNIKDAIKEIKLDSGKYNTYIVEIISFVGEVGQNTTVNKMARIYKMMELFISKVLFMNS